MSENGKTCPSSRCLPGASLLGVVGEDGRIKHLRTAMRITEDFVARASSVGPPEARFRFSGPCVESGCQQWNGKGCGVVEKVLAHIETTAPDLARKEVPPCTIRSSCRWYSQRGEPACLSCDLVVTGQNMSAAE